jgi:FAD:protein FMN transferase
MEIASRKEQVLGTEVEIKLPKENADLFPLCFSELERIERTYSRFLEISELSKLNSNLGVWQDASKELLWIVAKAEEFRKKTDGNFDITLKVALEKLGYDKDYSFENKTARESDPKERYDPSIPPIQIDQKRNRILLFKEIDFGGLGKGFALDQVAKLLDEQGVFHYCINAGGDIYAKKCNGEPAWRIILEHPDDSAKAIGTIEVDGQSLAASAPNKRKWGKEGLHHLLNAKTGLPANEAKAIFVLASSGIEADAYATALFTAGFENGIEIAQSLPIEILMASKHNKMFLSKGFNAQIFK